MMHFLDDKKKITWIKISAIYILHFLPFFLEFV